MNHRITLIIFAVFLAVISAQSAEGGLVQYSDGTEKTGETALAAPIELHVAKQVHRIEAERVAEIRLKTESEEMAAQWRMPEPGKTRKEILGKPYPVRQFAATVTLTDGSELSGHLYTTVVYLTAEDKTSKVIIRFKEQGQPGETLTSLVYPVRVRFPVASETARPRLLKIAAEGAQEIVLLTREGLARIEARAVEGAWRLPVAITPPAFLCVRRDDGLVASWPAGDHQELRAQVQESLAKDVLDYMDARTLLGVWKPADGDQVFSLVSLARTGSTTYKEDEKPWRLEVWRWRHDAIGNRLMLAGRGYFMRGTGRVPTVTVNHAWWDITANGDIYEVNHGR